MTTLVIGAGVFGVAGALELRRRGHDVILVEAGPLPHPDAASTDITKALRMEYGGASVYTEWMERAFDGWRRWQEAWTDRGMEAIYHEVGVLMMRRRGLRPGDFEHDSFEYVSGRGHKSQRLDGAAIAERFPAFAPGVYEDGFFNPVGGYAESGRAVAALAEEARSLGVTILEFSPLRSLLIDGEGTAEAKVRGAVVAEDGHIEASEVVLACGAWTPKVYPKLAEALRPSGHPVFHLVPSQPEPFRSERLPVFTADITTTGYYGFPLHRDGVIKVATHRLGRAVDPDGPRELKPEDEPELRAFLRESMPGLAEAELVKTRLCLYCDSQDEDFWIARDPELAGLTIASGGSGHGFKFAPVMGEVIAAAVEGAPHPMLDRFRWRPELRCERGGEAARCHDQE